MPKERRQRRNWVLTARKDQLASFLPDPPDPPDPRLLDSRRISCYLEHMSTCSDIQDLKAELFDADLVTSLADTFKVLGDVTRVRILDALSRQELCVGDISTVLGLSESAVSHQLRLLRNARLVRQRRAGQMIFYALDDHHVVRLFEQGSEHVRERDAGVGLRLSSAHPDVRYGQPTPRRATSSASAVPTSTAATAPIPAPMGDGER